MNREDIKDYLDYEEIIDLSKWNEYENQGHYYDYVLYEEVAYDKDLGSVIDYVDYYYEQREALESLGYSRSYCRSQMETFSANDFEYLVGKGIDYDTAMPYLEIKGCQIQDLSKYIKSKKDPEQAILSITYDFIDSRYSTDYSYLIVNPDHYDTLVKTGFMLPEDYEPDDLVEVDLWRDASSTNVELRQEAAQELERMALDAEEEDLYLGIRSGYRSYKDQSSVYNEYMNMYGYDYASTLVAVPGSSEHQLGYGVDITSLSVINEEIETFGDTPEFLWVMENAHKYGFILRYPEDKTELTGTMNEPWHFRYVGKDIAEECYKKNWTLEEYIQAHGFSTTLTRIEE
ncbi:MAG: M15 family metallopeptidase [Bacillota bacterium]|nr:M15 family metallopeptidase [Bacillota bacterium]